MTGAWILASTTAGGRWGVRRVVVSLAIAAGLAAVPPAAAQDGPAARAAITVREIDGTYQVDARFAVAQSPPIVLDVLTDYEAIPRILPDIKRSVVRERVDDLTVVEQEAVSGMLMFPRRIVLILAIRRSDGLLRFTDTARHSFLAYDGCWRVTAGADGGSDVRYELRARPAFSVPQFVLRRVLRRESQETIERLRAEMAQRQTSREAVEVTRDDAPRQRDKSAPSM